MFIECGSKDKSNKTWYQIQDSYPFYMRIQKKDKEDIGTKEISRMIFFNFGVNE